ncbi:hypothetical protein WJX72_003091 [[Myrmecia] bisecta]|uniref:RNA polymerase II C-terminal domain phosphatase-like n=1 Tax=[Myrmecia] bisecta TaxID=41462 RepID=A0AAW1P4I6_9CHLO
MEVDVEPVAAAAEGQQQQSSQQQQQQQLPAHSTSNGWQEQEDQLLGNNVDSLLREKRLCLVLDLDHTLVNSAKFSEIAPELEVRLLARLDADKASLAPEARELFRIQRIQMWTKLRPGVREFLQQAAQFFELWIHTNGNRSYALAMAELLDPQADLFGHRIIAQGSMNSADDRAQQDLSKRLMQGLEGREAIAVVLDDNSSVWDEHEDNLLNVERYMYFPSSRRQFGLKGKSLLEHNRDECPQRGMLMVALDVLLRVHARIIPLEQQPERHPLWKLALRFGATCVTQKDEAVTHVVTNTHGTEKVWWAQKSNKHVVLPAWLECSCTLWKRAHEERFRVQ